MVTVSQITPIPISDLPAATTLTGNEATALVQGGATVQAPVSALPQGMTAGVLVYGNTGGSPFPNYRTLKAGTNVTILDGGAQGDLTINVAGGTGLGSVTSVSVVTANGVSGSVANPTSTPAITLTLGSITPTAVAASGAVSGSNLTGTNTGDQNLFQTFSVAGQSDVVADSPTDTCTFVAGSGMTITTNASTDTITFTSSGGGGSVTTTGSPASGNLSKFSGASSITNADLSGDVTTSGTTLTTVVKINGATLGTTTATSGNLLIGSGTNWVTNAVSGDITINSTGVTAIGAGKVTNAMLLGSIAVGKVALTNTHLMVGNGSNVGADVAMSGDATLANTGAITIANNAVSNAKFRQSVAVSVVGNATNSTANVADLAATAGNQVLTANSAGTAISWQNTSLTMGVVTDSSTSFGNVIIYTGGPYTLSGSASMTSFIGHQITMPALSGNTSISSNPAGLKVVSGTVSGLASYGSNTYGVWVTAPINNSSTASMSSTFGAYLQTASISNAATMSTATGARIDMPSVTGASSVITNAYGINVTAPTVSSSGAITNCHAVNINNMGASGITTSYGIKIAAQSGSTTNWDLYCADGFYVQSTGDVIIGNAALTTSATSSFPWIPSCPGTPTGAPTAPYTNAAGVVWDSVDKNLYIRCAGAWNKIVGGQVGFRSIASGTTDSALSSDGTISWQSATTGAKTQTIPTAVAGNLGQVITVKDSRGTANTYNITITPVSGTIDGSATLVLSQNYDFVSLQSDGVSNWVAI